MEPTKEYKKKIPKNVYEIIVKGVPSLRPVQIKAIEAGIFKGKNLVVCSPTASGKTLVAEMAMLDGILNKKKKVVYIVPLRALASEKFKEFKEKYGTFIKIAISTGDFDSDDSYLRFYDLIITTSEKLDSLIRHHSPWLQDIGVVIVDEIHLLNDATRGPTLEVVISLIKKIINPQIIALSATIGNPLEISEWLDAELVYDEWRPVKLHKGVLHGNNIEFYEELWERE